jgi:hypothetical protein
VVLFQNLLLVVLAAWAATAMASDDLDTVHEWGTFTSVAGGDGSAMSWEPLSGPSDLPCFVHRLDQRNLKVAEWGTVRMETPVLYFYPMKPLTVSVHVDFPGGRVTEWYPQASSVQPSVSRKGWIEWKDVHVDNSSEPLPTLAAASHYYAARKTDSWSLTSGQENEKSLFYRGIGDFSISLRAIVHDDSVSITRNNADTIPVAILFENHAGRIGYSMIRDVRRAANISFSELTGTLDSIRNELEDSLTEMGLYAKEAHAMVETWRDSWFEEGSRVFYILPRSEVDQLLPISIHPSPGQLVRVFVGRVELLSPQMKQEIGAALLKGDVPELKKYGRFLNAFLREMDDGNVGPPMSDPAQHFLETSYTQALVESRKLACTE